MARITLHVLGMTLLGLLALWAFVAVVELRIGTPLEANQANNPTATVPALIKGVESDLRIAAAGLPANRSQTVHALDAAKRITELGTDAIGETFDSLHRTVMQARRSIANGDPELAQQLLKKALAVQVPARESPTIPADLQPYIGATVIDGEGIRVGEVTAVDMRGDKPKIQLSLGGVRNALGFIDVGGRRLWVQADALVFGKPKLLGSTLVAWSAGHSRPAQTSLDESQTR